MPPRLFAGLAFLVCTPLIAAEPPAGTIVPRDYLVISGVSRGGRSPVYTDALQAERLAGPIAAPKAGDKIGDRAWVAKQAGEDGVLTGPDMRGSVYARTVVTLDADRVMMLEAVGHSFALVNGEPRAGDPYSYGYVSLPVPLKKGENELLFQVGRGRLQVKLTPAPAEPFFDTRDLTAPDLPWGEWMGVVVVNPTAYRHQVVVVATQDGLPPSVSGVPPLEPFSVRKAAVGIAAINRPQSDSVDIQLSLLVADTKEGKKTGSATVKLRVRKPDQSQKRTFKSRIDDSVQYYAVQPGPGVKMGPPVPAFELPKDQQPASLALVLSLHGASVEALGQADAYSPKSWAHIVCPTNRRPYGFDWEDWGRWDALEVLEHARFTLNTDRTRTYLTGHSMGGHGAWQLGALCPNLFAAVGPSAGWPEFASYGGGRPRQTDVPPPLALVQRAGLPSETRTFERNYLNEGLYVLHGDKDDNVPVSLARMMRDDLVKFHKDFQYFEQPGAGHWWGAPDTGGAACVDWPPMFDLFARRVIPDYTMVRHVEFVTPSPGVLSVCNWAGIWQQQQAFRPSKVALDFDRSGRKIFGTTENVARLSLSLSGFAGGPIKFEIDGQKLETDKARDLMFFDRTGERWSIAPPSERGMGPRQGGEKWPEQSGPFKEAFNHHFQFVYGTGGTAEENAWARMKARFDAETFWYRGNGSVDVSPDTEFSPETTQPERSVVLYGHAGMNRAWAALLPDCPIKVERGSITVGDRVEKGDDLACLFVLPRPKHSQALVAVVAGTGLPGMRLTNHLPYFLSGVAYPDWTIIDSTMLTQGAAGIRGAGFFGNDWSLATGEAAWRE